MDNAKHFLSRVNWKQPWLVPLLTAADPVLQALDWRKAINTSAKAQDLRNHRGLPICFVQQEELPPSMAYETYISETGCVPTRDNLHDFFNALIWLTYPRIKAQLNALQAAEISSASEIKDRPLRRGKVRDAATIFDENAAVLITSDAKLPEHLRNHDWHDVFITHRDVFQNDCEVRLFGHALIEKLVTPYKAITAHTWIVRVEKSFFTMAEDQKRTRIASIVANQLVGGLETSNFTPLPVLGVPGWHEEQDDAFYADKLVFRLKRSSLARKMEVPVAMGKGV